jgi:hypothetical protein
MANYRAIPQKKIWIIDWAEVKGGVDFLQIGDGSGNAKGCSHSVLTLATNKWLRSARLIGPKVGIKPPYLYWG